VQSTTQASRFGDLPIKLALLLVYMVFAILLNSVGTVIQQSINSLGATARSAAYLDSFKDLPVAVVSFFAASMLPRFGYRRGMMLALFAIGAMCVAAPLMPSFWTLKLLFAMAGASFAIGKVAVYSTIGLLTTDQRGHGSFTSLVEAMFQIGVFAGSWLFAAFIDNDDPHSLAWFHVYWILAAIIGVIIVLLAVSSLDESAAQSHRKSAGQDFIAMLKLVPKRMVLVFIASAFIYVLIEQGISTWLPTFNNKVLHLPAAMSVQAASIFFGGLAVGRLLASALLRRLGWYPLLNVSLVTMAGLVAISLPLAEGLDIGPDASWFNAPFAAFLFPLIGLFMAPIYPVMCSTLLSSLPKSDHAPMMGLIVVFSALGGTTGSFVTGRIFAAFDGALAFYLLLVPMVLLGLSLFLFRRNLGAAEPVSSLEPNLVH
jgi:fucose permease